MKGIQMETRAETRNVSGFQRLEVREGANWVDLVVKPGEPELLTIEGPPGYVARVKSEVRGDTLKVSLAGGLSAKVKDALTTSLTRQTVRYHLTARNLVEIEVTGLVQVHLEAYGDDRPVVKDRLPAPPRPPRRR
jgi:hypothetical protein